jgi:hypothetical protein
MIAKAKLHDCGAATAVADSIVQESEAQPPAPGVTCLEVEGINEEEAAEEATLLFN